MEINDIYLKLSDYHVWATGKLLEALKPLKDEEYKKDTGMFFKSIHGTVNHLLLADKIWYSRFTKTDFPFTSLSQELHENRQELETELVKQVSLWKKLITEIDETGFSENLSYKDTKGNDQSTNIAFTLNHVFNHATHHRGQVSTVISQAGYTAPVLDLAYFIRL